MHGRRRVRLVPLLRELAGRAEVVGGELTGGEVARDANNAGRRRFKPGGGSRDITRESCVNLGKFENFKFWISKIGFSR